MKTFLIAIAIVILGVSAFATVDVTGKWAGTMVGPRPDGSQGSSPILFDLKQNGTTVTGKAGPTVEDQWPVEKGKVEGDKVSFVVNANGGQMVVSFELRLTEGHLKGTASAESNGQKRPATVDAERQK